MRFRKPFPKPPKHCKPVSNGEWVQPVRRGYLMECCDCGLKHSLDFRYVNTPRGRFIQFRAYRIDKQGRRLDG